MDEPCAAGRAVPAGYVEVGRVGVAVANGLDEMRGPVLRKFIKAGERRNLEGPAIPMPMCMTIGRIVRVAVIASIVLNKDEG